MRTGASLTIAALLALGVAACGDDDGGDQAADTTTSTTMATTSTSAAAGGSGAAGGGSGITIQGFAFSPATVQRGATVPVRNSDSAPHTVSADNGAFDVRVEPSASGSLTAPGQAGTYAYSCKVHPRMKGTLTVT